MFLIIQSTAVYNEFCLCYMMGLRDLKEGVQTWDAKLKRVRSWIIYTDTLFIFLCLNEILRSRLNLELVLQFPGATRILNY